MCIWYKSLSLCQCVYNQTKTQVLELKKISTPPGAAAIWTEQCGPGICPAAHLCPGPGRHPAGGTAANRHGVPHPAAVTGCWHPQACRCHQPQPGQHPGAQPAIHQCGRQHHQWRQHPQVAGYQRGSGALLIQCNFILMLHCIYSPGRCWFHKGYFTNKLVDKR